MKTHQGSCHCKAVRFEADIDLGQGTIRCNCSICAKRRFWAVIIEPHAFRLLSGEPDLAHYQFATSTNKHLFCRHCGVHTFGTGRSPRWGDFYAVSVTCLDDVSDEELGSLAVTFLDGRNDIWGCAPDHSRHL